MAVTAPLAPVIERAETPRFELIEVTLMLLNVESPLEFTLPVTLPVKLPAKPPLEVVMPVTVTLFANVASSPFNVISVVELFALLISLTTAFAWKETSPLS